MLLPQILSAQNLQAQWHTPVVIVGAGACGLTAALALHRLGVDCVVLERDAHPSGSSALSSGFVPAPATLAQKALGIDDSPTLFASDIQAKAHGQAAPQLVHAYCQTIGAALDALQVHHQIPWQVLDQFLYPGHSVHRMHAVPEKTGQALMNRLLAAAERAGVVILTQACVTQLYTESQGRSRGLGSVRPDGQVEQLSCDVVILACNGFGGNPDMVQQYLPQMHHAQYAGHAGNDGSAVAWGMQLGAVLADMGAYQGHGAWAVPQGCLISWALMMQGAVQINAQGERFHDETQGYSEAAVQVLAQDGGQAFVLLDAPLLEFAQDFPDFVQAQKVGAVRSAQNLTELAQLVGCQAHVLQSTLNQVKPGPDALTGRVFQRSLQAPFYAVRVTGALFHTQGGLLTDAHCRVLKAKGQPLPNLFAAGGAAGGVSGAEVWGYLSGNGLLSAIAGGHIAAHSAAQLWETL